MDDVLKVMRESGFTPKPVVDEDFPAVKGEYRVVVKALKPWTPKDGTTAEAYQLQLEVTDVLSGDAAVGRMFTRFYRIAGQVAEWDKATNAKTMRDVNAVDIIESVKKLANDVYTLDGAPTLDLSSTAAMEASFAGIIGAHGFIRAWHFTAQDDKDKQIQQWTLKQERHLKKAAGNGASKSVGF